MGRKKLAIKLSGAIGDLVIASALLPPLKEQGYDVGMISKGFTLFLCKNLPYESTFSLGDLDGLDLSKDWEVVPLNKFLGYMPYQEKISAEYTKEGKSRIGHLCEWMGYELSGEIRPSIVPSRDDVKIILDKDEVELGRQKICDISKNKNNFPVVIIAPESSVENKNLSRNQLREIVRGISGFAVPCLLEPLSENKMVDGATYVGGSLREATAILYASDACVGVDSAPFHMANAALQGTEFKKDINTSLEKILLLVGSSHPDSIKYERNKSIWSKGGCSVSPCGAHGYALKHVYATFFGTKFYGSDIEKDKSGCIFGNYKDMETAACMDSISPEEVVETVRGIVR